MLQKSGCILHGWIRILMLLFYINMSVAPASDRTMFIDNFRTEFNNCIATVFSNNATGAVVAEACSRITRLQDNLIAVEGTLLTPTQVRDLHEILVSVLHELVQIQGVPQGTFAFETAAQPIGKIGQPSYTIHEQQLRFLLSYRFRIADMAGLLQVSPRTISRRLRFFRLEREAYSQINDTTLDDHVTRAVSFNRMIGPSTVVVHLRNVGLRVQRQRVRDSMRRIDPTGFALRTMRRIQRRQYRVKGPNSLWHMDGNHKLITWRLVIHAAIDGYTRILTFIDVATNNRADTVFSKFLRGVSQYGTPSRVRTDGGGENNYVASFMEMHRGANRGSIIRGSSVHNQRVERLWGDVWRGTVNCYYDLFSFMERENILDSNNIEHLYALHYVFNCTGIIMVSVPNIT